MMRPASSGVRSPDATASSTAPAAIAASAADRMGGRSRVTGASLCGGASRSRQRRSAAPSPASAIVTALRVSASASPSSSASAARVALWRAPDGRPGLPCVKRPALSRPSVVGPLLRLVMPAPVSRHGCYIITIRAIDLGPELPGIGLPGVAERGQALQQRAHRPRPGAVKAAGDLFGRGLAHLLQSTRMRGPLPVPYRHATKSSTNSETGVTPVTSR